MSIYTSYYAKAKKLDPSEFEFVAISNSVPKWWSLPILKASELVPTWSLVKALQDKGITEDEFEKAYVDKLNNEIGLSRLVLWLRNLALNKNVVLLCYEKDGFCHRHIARRELNERYQMEITELE